MKDIAKLVNEYVFEKTTIQVMNDVFQTDNNFDFENEIEVVSMHEASDAGKEFVDGTRKVEQFFSYRARGKNAKAVRDTLDTILNLLDTEQRIRLSDGLSVQCKAVALPHFIEAEDGQKTIYECTVSVQYIE